MPIDGQPRPVFIAAVPREIAAVVAKRGWRADRTLLSRGIHLFEHEDAVIACAGMGAYRATLAIDAALALGPAQELISIGWAGACNPRFAVGTVIHPTIVVDAKTGERFFIVEPETCETPEILVTLPGPAGAVQKERVGISYYASAVDMEAATVARMARARELPFSAIKAISDDVDFELPDIAGFVDSSGNVREGAFAVHTAMRPWTWKPVLRLAKGSRLATEHLHAELDVQISRYRDQRRNLNQ